MDNRTFNRLTPDDQLAFFLGTAAGVFGEKRVQSLYNHILPLVNNVAGHGEPHELKHSRDPDDPKNNYWNGVWRVYDTDG